MNFYLSILLFFSLGTFFVENYEFKEEPFKIYVDSLDISDLKTQGFYKKIEVDSLYAGGWVLAKDLNNDSITEFVIARNSTYEKTKKRSRKTQQYVTAVSVINMEGELLWTYGDLGVGENEIHYDLPCQVFDYNDDGEIEIIFATKDSLIILEGVTGEYLEGFPLPFGMSDCMSFVKDIYGDSYLVLKDRYQSVGLFDFQGNNIWKITLPEHKLTSHYPYLSDINNDGEKDIWTGYTVISLKGDTLLDISKKMEGHLDCYRSYNDDSFLVTECYGKGLAMINNRGEIIWKIDSLHHEMISVGKLYKDSTDNFIICDIDHKLWGMSPLKIYNKRGELYGEYITKRSRRHNFVNWYSYEKEEIFIAQTLMLFDGYGNALLRFIAPTLNTEKQILSQYIDITGDGNKDLIIYNKELKDIYIYKNPINETGSAPFGTQVNYTNY